MCHELGKNCTRYTANEELMDQDEEEEEEYYSDDDRSENSYQSNYNYDSHYYD